MPPSFYIIDAPDVSNVGFHFSGTDWTEFAPPLSHISTVLPTRALAALPSQPLLVYMIRSDVDALLASTDGGATWTETPLPTLPSGRLSIDGVSLWTRGRGDVYLLNNRPDGLICGIWHTTNGGVTWTRIIPFPGPAFTSAGGEMALGVSKLFYAALVSETAVGSEFNYGWTFNRANLDGSGIETWARHTFSSVDHKDPYTILLRAISDDFVLAASNVFNSVVVASTDPQGLLWKIDASGITDIRPSGMLSPWDVLPLTATRWLAVGSTHDTQDVLVYRTDNAGTSWSLMTTISATQGLVASAYTDQFFVLSAPRPSRPDEVVMLGYASDSVQQIVWTSLDGGATWSSMTNTADVFDGTSWAVTATGGLAAVPPLVPASPSRLATIVG